jgi:uncharacterized protein YndB with AHSA1/START domain
MPANLTSIEPVRKTVTVPAAPPRAFELFTRHIHEWWPLATHSIDAGESGSAHETVIFQGGAGGQIYERTTKGEELKWADVVAFEPPHRFVLSWNPSREQDRPRTEIEVTFTDVEGKTRVDLEHRGWEKLGERAAEARQGYSQGWESVLAGFAESASG